MAGLCPLSVHALVPGAAQPPLLLDEPILITDGPALVAPGTLDTEAVRDLFGGETDAFLASEAAGNPSGRNITHDDYTGLVAFLASPEASMIQGQVIFVNGGQYIVA